MTSITKLQELMIPWQLDEDNCLSPRIPEPACRAFRKIELFHVSWIPLSNLYYTHQFLCQIRLIRQCLLDGYGGASE